MPHHRKIIYVLWRDAATELVYVHHGNAADYDPLSTVETVGIYVTETTEALTLATDHMPDEKRWRGIIGIPKVNIIRRVTLKVEVKS